MEKQGMIFKRFLKNTVEILLIWGIIRRLLLQNGLGYSKLFLAFPWESNTPNISQPWASLPYSLWALSGNTVPDQSSHNVVCVWSVWASSPLQSSSNWVRRNLATVISEAKHRYLTPTQHQTSPGRAGKVPEKIHTKMMHHYVVSTCEKYLNEYLNFICCIWCTSQYFILNKVSSPFHHHL